MATVNSMSDYVIYDAEYIPSIFPLHNTGAICWFNALLQAMLSIPSLNRNIIERDIDSHNRFSRSYSRVVDAALDEQGAALIGCSAELINAMHEQARLSGIEISLGSGQECADLALVKFIELLDCPHIDALFSTVYEMRIHCTGCDKTVSSVRDKNTRIQMFVPLRTEADFQRYLCVHKSEHDFFRCDCGHRMAKFDRLEVLKLVREVIVIVFDKFTRRNATPAPARLSFPRAGGGHLNYKLIAHIDHSGTANSGHYSAHVLRHEKWWCANDDHVSAGRATANADTFIAFYHMV